MKSRLETRAYTNALLTVIALLLIALTIHAYKVSLSSPAYAQTRSEVDERWGASTRQQPATMGNTVITKRAEPVDVSNIAMVQDPAVAGATTEVAAANRDIAAAIRELATAVSAIGPAIGNATGSGAAVPVPAVSGGPAPTGPAPGATVPAVRAAETMVEVAPAQP